MIYYNKSYVLQQFQQSQQSMSGRLYKQHERKLAGQLFKSPLLHILNLRITTQIIGYLDLYDVIYFSSVNRRYYSDIRGMRPCRELGSFISYNCKTIDDVIRSESGYQNFCKILNTSSTFFDRKRCNDSDDREECHHVSPSYIMNEYINEIYYIQPDQKRRNWDNHFLATDGDHIIFREEGIIKLYEIYSDSLIREIDLGDSRISSYHYFEYPYLMIRTGDFYSESSSDAKQLDEWYREHKDAYIRNRTLHVINWETGKILQMGTSQFVLRTLIQDGILYLFYKEPLPSESRERMSVREIKLDVLNHYIDKTAFTNEADCVLDSEIGEILDYINYLPQERQVMYDFQFNQCYFSAFIDSKYSKIWDPLSKKRYNISDKLRDCLRKEGREMGDEGKENKGHSIKTLHIFEDVVVVIYQDPTPPVPVYPDGGLVGVEPPDMYLVAYSGDGELWRTNSHYWKITVNPDLNSNGIFTALLDHHLYLFSLYTGEVQTMYTNSCELSSAVSVGRLSFCITEYFPNLEFIDMECHRDGYEFKRDSDLYYRHQISIKNSSGIATHRGFCTTLSGFDSELLYIGKGKMIFSTPGISENGYISVWEFNN